MNFPHRTFAVSTLLAIAIVIALAMPACDNVPALEDSSPVKTTPTGAGVADVPILRPFAGRWAVDENETLTLWKAAGKSQKDFDEMREIQRQLDMPLHTELDIEGNVIVMPGEGKAKYLDGELLLFSMHTHGPWICGKAWHHEDRHDPGDMNKCYVRLQIKNDLLLLSTRDKLKGFSVNDPDLENTLTPEGGSEVKCKSDKQPETTWSPWQSFAFRAVQVPAQ